MENIKLEKQAIAILGMHRSGTSTVSRLLNLIGVYLGKEEDLVKPLPENPKGFWEREDLYRFHESLLAKLNNTWSSVSTLPEDWHLTKEIAPFRERLSELVEEKFSNYDLWGWKDPRSSLLMPLWIDVLSKQDISVSCVLVVRNPLDIVRSLKKRDGFTQDKACGIWYNYTLTALQLLYTMPYSFISYDKLFDDWEKELKRCISPLNLNWAADEKKLREEVQQFLFSDLRHSASTLDDLKNSNMHPLVINLYTILEKAMKEPSKKNENIKTELTSLFKELRSYSRFFRYDSEQGQKTRTLELEKKDREIHLSNLQQEITRMEKDREIHLSNLQQEITRMEAEKMEMFRSLSWKVCAPLRFLEKKILRQSFRS